MCYDHEILSTSFLFASILISFLSMILKLNQNARFQCRTENHWWRGRWQIFARILVWKQFAGGMKNAAGRRQQIPGDESDFTLILLIRCVVTQYNLGCGPTGSKNTLTKVQILAMFLMRKNNEWTNNLGVHESKSFKVLLLKPTHLVMFFLKALSCDGSDPTKCPELWGVFNYMPNRTSGECGIRNGSWCTSGKTIMASPGKPYYALCAVALGKLYNMLAARYSYFFLLM